MTVVEIDSVTVEDHLTRASACPFSVEMIADETDDGSATSVQLQLPILQSSSNKLALEEDDEEEPGPDLVRVDSSENSASSTSSQEKETALAPASSSSQEMVKKSQEDVGMIDCLSDQFSNLFCPFGESHLCLSKNQPPALTCEVPCQAFDPADPSTDVFSHLQYWWSPSHEEKLTLQKTPKNRPMRKKHRHVKSLMDNWHPRHAEPLVRSKSILDGRPSSAPAVPLSPTMETAHYDSDPEEVYKNEERRESMHSRSDYRSRRPSPLNTSLGDDSLMFPQAPKNANRNHFHFASSDRAPLTPSHMDLMSPESDDYIREFVQEVTNSRLNLIWHRYHEPEGECVSDGLRAPMAVSATFEVGTHLDHKVVQPKLTWNPSNKQQPKKQSQAESNWVELLSIIRVIVPQKLNRELYPFARTDRTLCIVANDNRNPYLVFEAESKEQRDWLVTALKMTVARLASIIIIKDESMLLEFFSPYAALLSLREHETDDEDEEDLSEEDHLMQDKDALGLDANGELNLMEMSPVLFNPKDL